MTLAMPEHRRNTTVGLYVLVVRIPSSMESTMPNTVPTKETVRHWMEHRHAEHKPPPDQKDIRRKLGWELLKAHRNNQRKIVP